MNYYLDAIKYRFADFGGRARRKEYWGFYIYNISFFGLAILLDAAFNPHQRFEFIPATLQILYPFLMALPTLAITTRRLHDLGKSGILLAVVLIPLVIVIWIAGITELVWFIPILGPMLIFPFLTNNGQTGTNKYGPCPKNNS